MKNEIIINNDEGQTTYWAIKDIKIALISLRAI